MGTLVAEPTKLLATFWIHALNLLFLFEGRTFEREFADWTSPNVRHTGQTQLGFALKSIKNRYGFLVQEPLAVYLREDAPAWVHGHALELVPHLPDPGLGVPAGALDTEHLTLS
jgi:hypothetical protein